MVALHDGSGPAGGDRLVVGRGRAARLHRDRPRVQPARTAARLPLHDERARRRRAVAARRAAALRDRQRPRLPRRPAGRRQHGLGLRPGPPRPVRGRRRRSRGCRASTSSATSRTPSGCRSTSSLGDLAPASNEVVFGEVLKPLIAKAYDVTYVEYYRRGLEDLPEEAPAVFDWMDQRRREPYPKTFDVVTARESRQPLLRRRRSASSSPAGRPPPRPSTRSARTSTRRRIKMKSSSLSNLLNIQINGIKRLDVWVSPKLIDFKQEARGPDQRQTLLQGAGQARPRAPPRRPSAPRRPPADLLDEGVGRLTSQVATWFSAMRLLDMPRVRTSRRGPCASARDRLSSPRARIALRRTPTIGGPRERTPDPRLGARRDLLPDLPRPLRAEPDGPQAQPPRRVGGDPDAATATRGAT